jgi:hypothetical protein
VEKHVDTKSNLHVFPVLSCREKNILQGYKLEGFGEKQLQTSPWHTEF